jgi:hypothetical protein
LCGIPAPDEVVEVLNQYLGEMTDAISDHGGTLVAYLGDGILAVFGAPIEQDDHADRALAASRERLQVRQPAFCECMKSAGHGIRVWSLTTDCAGRAERTPATVTTAS